ncbi:MAG: c-type cytochrome domain-containing protein [Armatimonadota bacterium]
MLRVTLSLTGVTAGFLALLGGASSAAPAAVSFHKDVQPILKRQCAGCHQPSIRGGKLSVVTYAALKSGGTLGPGFVSGKPADSPLYKLISGKNPSMPKDMPPLNAREVETIRLWIEQGARDDTPVTNDPIGPSRPPVYTQPPVISSLAYSPDGETLAVAGYREILLHKADGSGLLGRLVGRSQRIESLAFSPDAKTLAAVGGTSCKFGELQLWDVATRKQLKSVEIGFDVLYGVSFSPDGKLVAFGGAEKAAYLYSVPQAEQLLKFENHSDWVFSTTFSSDSKHMISTSRDRAVKLVEIATKNFVDDINYQVYNGGYSAMARRPGVDEVAVGGEEGLVRLYSIHKKQARTINRDDYNLLRTFEKLDGPIFSLAFNPDGSLLAVGGDSSEVRIYKVADGTRAGTIQGHSGAIHSLAWHPKGDRLATVGFDGNIRLYSAADGKLAKEFVPVPITRRQPKVAAK